MAWSKHTTAQNISLLCDENSIVVRHGPKGKFIDASWTHRTIGSVLCALVLSNFLTFSLTTWAVNVNLDEMCTMHTTQAWSPMLDGVNVRYETVRFDGAFFKDNIYRQDASPEVDKAWLALGIEYRGILVPKAMATKAGIPIDRASVNETYGGPGYPAIFEVFHQLHCLNMLRQSLYFNVDYYTALGEGPFAPPQKQLRSHVGHCLDMLRQQLMCNADTGLHPFLWVGDPPHAFPDFSRLHKCKNFDDMLTWAEANQGNFEEARFDMPGNGELVLEEVP